MVAIIDYGVGNLFSLKSSLAYLGVDSEATSAPERLIAADRLILPGVGAFGDAAAKLRQSGLDRIIKSEVRKGKPILGICLGMQLLFRVSYEFGKHEGLGLLEGEIRPISEVIPKGYKIPHIGWNGLTIVRDTQLLANNKNGDFVYFVHSFYAAGCDDSVAALTEYGAPLTAAVAKGNVFGCQFHPEKSGDVGLSILRAFCGKEILQ